MIKNFIEHGFDIKLNNKYMDTLQFSRKLYPELKRHRLNDMTEYLQIEKNNHRALHVCISTKILYDKIKQKMEEKNLGIYDLWYKKVSKSIDMKSIVPENDDIDEDNLFYNRVVAFTGKLEKMTRREAAQLVVNKGGICNNSFTKKTNYLVLGDNSYNHSLKNGQKSSKHIAALKAIEEGRDLEIIDELSFYNLLEE